MASNQFNIVEGASIRNLFVYLQYKACVAGVERGRGSGERQKRRAD